MTDRPSADQEEFYFMPCQPDCKAKVVYVYIMSNDKKAALYVGVTTNLQEEDGSIKAPSKANLLMKET